MKIMINVHFSFFDSPHRPMDWIETYCQELVNLGHEVEKFDSFKHSIKKFDLIHLFSQSEPETWHVLKQIGLKVIITPSLENIPQLSMSQKIYAQLIRLGRSLSQRKWTPRDDRFFYGRGDRYLVFSNHWRSFLVKEWRINPSKIDLISMDPKKCAGEAKIIYQKLCLSK